MGFPTRHTRAAFGPTDLRDRIKVRDPTMAIPAATYKLAWWQLAGLNVTGFLALAELVIDGVSAVTLGASAEAWDPDGALLPVPTKPAGVGLYRLTYDATYPDENAQPVVTQLSFALPQVSDLSTLYHARAKPSAANVMDVQVFDSAGAAVDPVNVSIFVPIW